MDIKNIPVRNILIFKYLACKLLINLENDPDFRQFNFKSYINNKARDRVGEKYSIINYKSKNLSQIFDELNISKDDRLDFANSTYDYIVNKEFTIVNDEFLESTSDSVILKPVNVDALKIIYKIYGKCNIFIIEDSEYSKLVDADYFTRIFKLETATEPESKKKYVAVIAE